MRRVRRTLHYFCNFRHFRHLLGRTKRNRVTPRTRVLRESLFVKANVIVTPTTSIFCMLVFLTSVWKEMTSWSFNFRWVGYSVSTIVAVKGICYWKSVWNSLERCLNSHKGGWRDCIVLLGRLARRPCFVTPGQSRFLILRGEFRTPRSQLDQNLKLWRWVSFAER